MSSEILTVCKKKTYESQRSESNRQPLVYKTSALPLSYVGESDGVAFARGGILQNLLVQCKKKDPDKNFSSFHWFYRTLVFIWQNFLESDFDLRGLYITFYM